jgi:hypothetical protein
VAVEFIEEKEDDSRRRDERSPNTFPLHYSTYSIYIAK